MACCQVLPFDFGLGGGGKDASTGQLCLWILTCAQVEAEDDRNNLDDVLTWGMLLMATLKISDNG